MSQRVVVHICRECGTQQWFAGSCADCYGRVDSFQAVLVKDILKAKERTVEQFLAGPGAIYAESFVDLLLDSSRLSSGG